MITIRQNLTMIFARTNTGFSVITGAKLLINYESYVSMNQLFVFRFQSFPVPSIVHK